MDVDDMMCCMMYDAMMMEYDSVSQDAKTKVASTGPNANTKLKQELVPNPGAKPKPKLVPKPGTKRKAKSKSKLSEVEKKCGDRLRSWLSASAPGVDRIKPGCVRVERDCVEHLSKMTRVVTRPEIVVGGIGRKVVQLSWRCGGESSAGLCQSDQQIKGDRIRERTESEINGLASLVESESEDS